MQTKVQSGMAASWFTPKNQNLPDDKQRSYQFKPMDGWQCIDLQYEWILNQLTKEGVKISVRNGLIGWKNITDNAGEPVDFDIGVVGYIPSDELIELAYEICAVSNLTEREIKN